MMRIKYNLSMLGVVLGAMLSTQSHAIAPNPATTAYVNEAIRTIAGQLTYRAGNGIAIVGDEISVTPELAVGDFYQGGIVFYVDNTRRHGLAIGLNAPSTSPVEFSGPAPNGTESESRLYALSNGIGAGAANTAAMNAFQSASCNTAATDACLQTAGPIASLYTADATTGAQDCTLPTDGSTMTFSQTDCISGWYLPSVYEWLLLAQNVTAVNTAITALGGAALTDTNYWTSNTSTNGTQAYVMQTILTSPQASLQAWTLNLQTRAIRRF
jgi:hypothetical protein